MCSVTDLLQSVVSHASKARGLVFADPISTAYWAYHLTRTGFLSLQGMSGMR